MHPFISVLGKELPAYGVMAVIGGLAGFLPVFFLGQKNRLDRENLVYLYVMGIVGGVFGVAVLHSLTGALIGASIAFLYWSKAFKTDRAVYEPVMAAGIPLCAFCIRIGCTMAGCCYGIPVASSFHIVFHHSPVAPAGIPLLPTQPMEAAFHLLWFPVLFLPEALGRRARINVLWYFAAYGLYRLFIDFFRGDRGRVFPPGWTIAQAVSLLFFAAAVWCIVRQHRHAEGTL